MNDFIDRNIDSPLNLLTPNLARLIALGGFRRLSPKVNQFMKDPRLQKVYSFQAMYAGVSPQPALAIYAVIAYMDSVNGVRRLSGESIFLSMKSFISYLYNLVTKSTYRR